ncbi:M48 family metalloprotease [Staphylococcus ursi]|uniref:M48 family metallopeptidase n=1 Tax=Staphylococcus sp. MI 10-1553 TaxID=1912064 RepID=UPI001398BD2C|nr:M48 family metallopeptidase [Staphylococcus sp. MI 10-1553]QHW38021.1 M48 family metalloprotease [Staphylococcus sp. MI 10-1553]
MRFLAILIYILVVLIRINIIKTPYLDENSKSLIFIFATILIPNFIIRPIFNSSNKNLLPLNYKELEESLTLPEGTKIYTKKSVINNGIYVKGGFHKNSIVINPELIKKVNVDELRFLIHHEIAHIKNNDITKNQFYFALSYGVLPILLILISRVLDFKSMNQFIIYIVLAVVIYFGGILLYFLHKRQRELKCDRYASNHSSREIGVRALITLKKLGILKDTKLVLFADHPNLNKRIENLENI